MAKEFYLNVEDGPKLTNITFKMKSYMFSSTPTITNVTKGWKVVLNKQHNKVRMNTQ